jgi:hypothetical protein
VGTGNANCKLQSFPGTKEWFFVRFGFSCEFSCLCFDTGIAGAIKKGTPPIPICKTPRRALAQMDGALPSKHRESLPPEMKGAAHRRLVPKGLLVPYKDDRWTGRANHFIHLYYFFVTAIKQPPREVIYNLSDDLRDVNKKK